MPRARFGRRPLSPVQPRSHRLRRRELGAGSAVAVRAGSAGRQARWWRQARSSPTDAFAPSRRCASPISRACDPQGGGAREGARSGLIRPQGRTAPDRRCRTTHRRLARCARPGRSRGSRTARAAPGGRVARIDVGLQPVHLEGREGVGIAAASASVASPAPMVGMQDEADLAAPPAAGLADRAPVALEDENRRSPGGAATTRSSQPRVAAISRCGGLSQ